MHYFDILYEQLSGFLITVWNLFLSYWHVFLLLLLLIPFVLVAFRYIRILLCRAHFLFCLKKHCKHRGISCQFSRSALPLLFSRRIDITARLSLQDKSMTVCLFPLLFGKGGLYFKQHRIYISKAKAISLYSKNEKALGLSSSPSLVSVDEGAFKKLRISLPAAEEEHSVLVFCPSRRFVYAYQGNHYAAVDSGEVINGYCIYQSNNLSHYIDRFF